MYLTIFSRDLSLLARKALKVPLMPALVAWRKSVNKHIDKERKMWLPK